MSIKVPQCLNASIALWQRPCAEPAIFSAPLSFRAGPTQQLCWSGLRLVPASKLYGSGETKTGGSCLPVRPLLHSRRLSRLVRFDQEGDRVPATHKATPEHSICCQSAPSTGACDSGDGLGLALYL